MNAVQAIERAFRTLLPSPFTIAVLLTLTTMLLAWAFTGDRPLSGRQAHHIMTLWENGLWNQPLLVFAVQMMLMLVLGHILALSAPAERVIALGTRYCEGTARSAAIVAFVTIMVSLFNWGLGLVFGAIFARKVGERAAGSGMAVNYPLIGAAGYSGMMTWHCGLSGSAPIKVAEAGHVHQILAGVVPAGQMASFPDRVLLSETVFSSMNLTTVVILLLLIPALLYVLGRRFPGGPLYPDFRPTVFGQPQATPAFGAERLDRSRVFTLMVGSGVVLWCVSLAATGLQGSGLAFITPNFINLLLLGLALSLHRSIHDFLRALDAAIGGASGILIQFPLYFGIMGVMSGSGLAGQLSDFFVSISDSRTFPVLTMLSAGLLNVFIPSGGGQWGVQGPVVLKAAMELGTDIPKSIMALAYGDQLTNMLQPFWALPLLGITGLSAKDILPYSMVVMLLGALVFGSVLLIF